MRIRIPDPLTRFWAKVRVPDDNGCLNWMASHNRNGYGVFTLGKKRRVAHRWLYEQLVGDVADGLELDHLCRNKGCVNVTHLEPVTRSVNILRGDGPKVSATKRKTHCFRGHELTPENTYVQYRPGNVFQEMVPRLHTFTVADKTRCRRPSGGETKGVGTMIWFVGGFVTAVVATGIATVIRLNREMRGPRKERGEA